MLACSQRRERATHIPYKLEAFRDYSTRLCVRGDSCRGLDGLYRDIVMAEKPTTHSSGPTQSPYQPWRVTVA